jgi:hypothetical protein
MPKARSRSAKLAAKRLARKVAAGLIHGQNALVPYREASGRPSRSYGPPRPGKWHSGFEPIGLLMQRSRVLAGARDLDTAVRSREAESALGVMYRLGRLCGIDESNDPKHRRQRNEVRYLTGVALRGIVTRYLRVMGISLPYPAPPAWWPSGDGDGEGDEPGIIGSRRLTLVSDEDQAESAKRAYAEARRVLNGSADAAIDFVVGDLVPRDLVLTCAALDRLAARLEITAQSGS